MQDTILFISSYKIVNIKKNKFISAKLRRTFSLRKKNYAQSLLKKHHLSFVATDTKFISTTENLNVKMYYDNILQQTEFSFESSDTPNKKDTIPNTKESAYYFNLRHAQFILVDDRYFKIEFTYGIEPFLVWIKDVVYQIDSFAFKMNDALFIVFEIIDYKTGKTLSKDDVNSKFNNFNLIHAEKYQFFGDQEPQFTYKKISELIYNQLYGFMSDLIDQQYKSDHFFYVFDTLILSNDIKNIPEYLCKFMSVKLPPSEINDISTAKICEYYPQDGCSLISNIDNEHFNTVLYLSILLEALKLYIYNFQNEILENETDLRRLMRNTLYLQNLFYAPHLPAQTQNMLDFVKESSTYANHAEALKLKLSFMTVQNDLKKNRISTVLNILLYILSFISAIGTLDIIECHLGIPFNFSFIAVIILFGLGLIWWIIEYQNNKSL